MPYKKGSVAHKNAQIRRTAKRRIQRLEKEMRRATSYEDKAYYQSTINRMNEIIRSTYVRKNDVQLAEVAGENLNQMNINTRMNNSEQARKNFITQQQLNRGGKKDDFIGPNRFSEEEVKIFYRSTQEAWDRSAANGRNRNEVILEYYGKKDLESFVLEVLELNKEAIKRAYDYAYEKESEEALGQEVRKEEGSPDFIMYVQPLSSLLNMEGIKKPHQDSPSDWDFGDWEELD